MLPLRLLVVHDAVRRGQDYVAELARREQVDDPLFQLARTDVEPRRDDAALINASDELDDNLAGAMVIDNLELADVACSGKRHQIERGGGWTAGG